MTNEEIYNTDFYQELLNYNRELIRKLKDATDRNLILSDSYIEVEKERNEYRRALMYHVLPEDSSAYLLQKLDILKIEYNKNIEKLKEDLAKEASISGKLKIENNYLKEKIQLLKNRLLNFIKFYL